MYPAASEKPSAVAARHKSPQVDSNSADFGAPASTDTQKSDTQISDTLISQTQPLPQPVDTAASVDSVASHSSAVNDSAATKNFGESDNHAGD